MRVTMKIEGADEIGKTFDRLGPEAQREAKTRLRAVSLAMMGRVKTDMPVDQGRARASWGMWTPQDIVEQGSDASEADSFYEESNDGMTITQGSNVEYIQELNDGSSTQAPAGFIDNAFKAAQDMLLKQVNELLGGLIK